jgi:type I restriction enzyme M protein
MAASPYEDYDLVLPLLNDVTDKYAGQKKAMIDMPVGGGFADMASFKGDKQIGDKIIGKLSGAGDNTLTGAITLADFSDPVKLGSGKDVNAGLLSPQFIS